MCNETSAAYLESLTAEIKTHRDMFGTTEAATGQNMSHPQERGRQRRRIGAHAAAWLMLQQGKNWGPSRVRTPRRRRTCWRGWREPNAEAAQRGMKS